ncbi:MAG TPA: Rad52/Rad22 family DNA repair protein [Terriglobales bacterium]|nr:Rad52/Rad22 family DNA repair protein [Terriglobales bacterium]
MTRLLAELEIPFPGHQVQWRITNTSNDKRRGQIVPYADPRAYTDRLNALLTPHGWTRKYQIETMHNLTRIKKGESIISGKVLVTCTVAIIGLGEHSGTGEDWADDDHGMTAADAQAFKRACSCFGLGRYFYYFQPRWVDLDEHRQPKQMPRLPLWAVPENWAKGMRPPGSNGNGNGIGGAAGYGHGSASNGSENGNGRGGTTDGEEVDRRIAKLEAVVGPGFYRNVLRQYGRASQPRLIGDIAVKHRVLSILESATRGFCRLQAVSKRLPPEKVTALLAKLQAPAPSKITDMRTLQAVVLGLEELAGPNYDAR